MTSITQNTRQALFTGKHMALIMVGFFGIIITVNFTMAYLASNTWTGLVVKNTYVASQQYNETLKAAGKQKALGLTSKISYHKHQLSFSIKDSEENRLELTNPVLQIGRPAFEQADQSLRFLPGKDFTNLISIHLQPGAWALTITGQVNGAPYRRDARLYVNENSTGTVQ